MAKKVKQRQDGADRTGGATEPAALKDEVAAFAAQLGLASGGEHAFDDFAPQAAKWPAGKPPKRKAAAAAAADGGEDAVRADLEAAKPAGKKRKQAMATTATDRGSRRTGNDKAAPAEPAAIIPPVSDEMMTTIKERGWNSGIGPRPGEGKRSLMERDAPALWYEAAAALPPLPAAAAKAVPLTEAQVAALRARGEALLEWEATAFEAELGRKNGQDARWLQQVRRSGTTSDKVAALTLLLQESAVANVKSLDQLVAWVERRRGGRTVVGQAIDAASEIFLTALLPDRKLRWLAQQPLAALPSGRDGERCLLFWTLEDAIKQRYGAFVAALAEGSKDSLEWVKERAMKAAAELLRRKPEAEAQLLSVLVNKLGDPSRKLASKAGYQVGVVLAEHPGMKAVVVAEVQRFLFRPGLQERARYYAIVFLTQLPLSHHASQGGGELAKKLIDVYLTLFQLIMTGKVGHAAAAQRAAEERGEAARVAQRAKKGKGRGRKAHKHPPKAPDSRAVMGNRSIEEVDARMLGALVAGVRRAFPYVDAGEVEEVIDRHASELFRVAHAAPLGVALQVLALLLQLMAGRRAVSDRFYRALYAIMLSAEVGRTSKAPMFVSLVFKAMKADVSVKRVTAFAKRLLQVALQSPGPFAAGTLFLLSEVLKAKSALWPAILQPQDTADEVERFHDAPDPDAADADAAAADTAAASPAREDADGPAAASPPADSGLEEPEDGALAGEAGSSPAQDALRAAAAAEAGARPQQTDEPPWPRPGTYDMHKREPMYCGAETAGCWELAALAAHAHPSVTAMATTLLAGDSVVYDGDPLRDLSLPAFLDKFVRRKPKTKARGVSVMQPLGPASGQDAGEAAAAAAEPGSSAFAALAAAEVKPDAVFFHKYYSAKELRQPKKAAQRPEGEDSDASEAEIDELMNDEEETGPEGIGAMPDAEYDYSTLADAFDASDAEAAGSSDEDATDAGGVSPAGSQDDVNVFELASPSGSGESFSLNSSPDESDGSEDSDDDSNGGRGGAFASADDWAQRIDEHEHEASASPGSPDDDDDAAEAAAADRRRRPAKRAEQQSAGVISAGVQKLNGKMKRKRR